MAHAEQQMWLLPGTVTTSLLFSAIPSNLSLPFCRGSPTAHGSEAWQHPHPHPGIPTSFMPRPGSHPICICIDFPPHLLTFLSCMPPKPKDKSNFCSLPSATECSPPHWKSSPGLLHPALARDFSEFTIQAGREGWPEGKLQAGTACISAPPREIIPDTSSCTGSGILFISNTTR